MTPKAPESSFLNPPHKVEGTPKEARASFYELAKDKIKYVDTKTMRDWQRKVAGRICISTASCVFAVEPGKKIDNLEIVVNKDTFNIKGKDYSDLIPFILEHEIYEAWLNLKKGVASKIGKEKRHLLALRREFLLAEQQGLGDKLLEYHTLLSPSNRKKSEYAFQAAKKQLGHLRPKGEGGEK